MRMDRAVESGAFWLPGEIKSLTQAIDRAVMFLNTQIEKSQAPLVNEPFREAWKDFMSRWQITRDTILQSWQSRMFASKVVPRLEDFQQALQRWREDFQKRVPGATEAPPLAPKEEPGLFEAIAQKVQTIRSSGPSLAFPFLLGGIGVFTLMYALRKKS